jgi:hypothetical protein
LKKINSGILISADFCHQTKAGGLLLPHITEQVYSEKCCKIYQPWMAMDVNGFSIIGSLQQAPHGYG